MSVAEILEQVKALSVEERKALMKQVIDLMDVPPVSPSGEIEGHWGQNLLHVLEGLGALEVAHPEIADSVEWVKTMRRESRERRLGDWGKNAAPEESLE